MAASAGPLAGPEKGDQWLPFLWSLLFGALVVIARDYPERLAGNSPPLDEIAGRLAEIRTNSVIVSSGNNVGAAARRGGWNLYPRYKFKFVFEIDFPNLTEAR